MKDPLVHLLRNAVDHGIETPDVRGRCGKPARATITLAASRVNSGNALAVDAVLEEQEVLVKPARRRAAAGLTMGLLPSPHGTPGTIKVLVVDDSKVLRLLLVHLLESDPQIGVIGAVDDGQAALDFVSKQKPDVVVMDIHMPGLDGFKTTRRLMETYPVPIVICSATSNPQEVATTFKMMEAGAVACIAKPTGPEHPEFEERVAMLLGGRADADHGDRGPRVLPSTRRAAGSADCPGRPAQGLPGADPGGATHRIRLSAGVGRVVGSHHRVSGAHCVLLDPAAGGPCISGAR